MKFKKKIIEPAPGLGVFLFWPGRHSASTQRKSHHR